MEEGKEVTYLAANALAEKLNADVILCSGGMNHMSDFAILKLLREMPNRRANLFLIIATFGGMPEVGYRIARYIRLFYKNKHSKLYLCIPYWCMSAGSLLAIAADELIITDEGQLGPIDIQVRRREEVGEYGSGLTSLKALDALREESWNIIAATFTKLRDEYDLSTKQAMELATNVSIGLLRPLYEQVDPQRVAENQRAVSIMSHYANRLATDNVKQGTISTMVGSYPTHDFVIDREEVRTLFNEVKAPEDQELAVLTEVNKLIFDGLREKDTIVKLLSNVKIVKGDSDEPQTNNSATTGGADSNGATKGVSPSGGPASGSGKKQPNTGSPANDTADPDDNGKQQDKKALALGVA